MLYTLEVFSFELDICCFHFAIFRAGSMRIYNISYVHLILRYFGFTLLVCCLVRDDKQSGRPHSHCPPGKLFPHCILHNCFRDCLFYLLHSMDITISFFMIDLL